MQLKLLNYYKFLSNFANNLVGAFIPLIIYKETGSLAVAFLYLIAHHLIKIGINFALKNQLRKRPQIFLLLRIFTLTGYSVFILLLEKYLWLSVISICIFNSLDSSFRLSANEIIYNYSSLNKNTDSLGISRVFEQMGVIASLLIGGYLLDINRKLVVVISLVLYGISVIPLLVYYLKSKTSSVFNKDAVSNAVIAFEKNVERTKIGKKLVFQILLTYVVVYFAFSTYDVIRNVYAFDLFLKGSDSFGQVGVIGAVFNGTFGVGSYFAGKLNDRYDLMWLVQLTCVIMGASVLSLVFVENIYVVYVMFGVAGAFYPFLSLFVYQRLIVKSRILGVSNSALLGRDNACLSAYAFIYLIAMLSAEISYASVTLAPVYIVVALFLFGSAYFVPRAEERTRKLLVDYLQNNEIQNEEKIKKSRVRRPQRKSKHSKSAAATVKKEAPAAGKSTATKADSKITTSQKSATKPEGKAATTAITKKEGSATITSESGAAKTPSKTNATIAKPIGKPSATMAKIESEKTNATATKQAGKATTNQSSAAKTPVKTVVGKNSVAKSKSKVTTTSKSNAEKEKSKTVVGKSSVAKPKVKATTTSKSSVVKSESKPSATKKPTVKPADTATKKPTATVKPTTTKA